MPALFAIDVNSKFEIEPAVKDSGMLGVFIKAVRNE
jgi:phosphoribosylanthranilate isomerase